MWQIKLMESIRNRSAFALYRQNVIALKAYSTVHELEPQLIAYNLMVMELVGIIMLWFGEILVRCFFFASNWIAGSIPVVKGSEIEISGYAIISSRNVLSVSNCCNCLCWELTLWQSGGRRSRKMFVHQQVIDSQGWEIDSRKNMSNFWKNQWNLIEMF